MPDQYIGTAFNFTPVRDSFTGNSTSISVEYFILVCLYGYFPGSTYFVITKNCDVIVYAGLQLKYIFNGELWCNELKEGELCLRFEYCQT